VKSLKLQTSSLREYPGIGLQVTGGAISFDIWSVVLLWMFDVGAWSFLRR
jgi:hypothetical protein